MRLYIDADNSGTLTELELKSDDIGLVMNRNVFKVELKQDRSFTVTLPATPANNKAFRLSNKVYSDVYALRTTYYAQLHYSGGWIEGELKVTKATSESYSVAFYYNGNTNEMIEAKLATYLEPGDFDVFDYVMWTKNPTYVAGGGAGIPNTNYGLFKYRLALFNQGDPQSDTTSRLPCVRYKYLTELAASKLGCTVNFDITDATELANKTDRYERLMIKTVTHNGRRTLSLYTAYEWGRTDDTGMSISPGFATYFTPTRHGVFYYNNSQQIVGSVGVQILVAQYDTTVTVTQLSGVSAGSPIASFVYTKDLRTWNPVTVGTAIPIKAGESFIVANGAHGNYPQYGDIFFGGTTPGTEGWIIYFDFDIVEPMDVDTYGSPYIYLYDNIPDVSLSDLLKTLAYVLNLGLYFQPDNKRFILTDLSFPTLQALPPEVDKPRELTISEAALNGEVGYNSSKYVIAPSILHLGTGTEEVYKMPFSEERIASISTTQDVLIDDIAYADPVYNWSGSSDKMVLCVYNDSSSQYLRRIDFMEGRLSGLSGTGVSVKVDVVQSAYDFLQMQPTTCFLWELNKWGILSANNKGGVTSLQMLRLDEAVKSQGADPYLEWLKSLGCVLWLPFAADGDLKDRISGNDLQPTSDTSGYFAWDSNAQMMYYHSPSSNSVKSHTLQTIWDNNTFANNEFTVLTEYAKKSATGYSLFFMLGNTYTIPVGAALLYNGSVNMTNWGNYQEHKCAYYIGSGGRKIYQDGVLYNTYGVAPGYLPSVWGSFDYFAGAADATIGLNDVLNREIYVRNIMIFNRELSLSEIRDIQGYQ